MCQDIPHRREVGAAEEIEMVQEMIQIIEAAAGFVAGLQGSAFPVGCIEIVRESAEQFCHG